MSRLWTGFRSVFADGMRAFLAYKRALGRHYRAEESALRLLDRFLVEHRVSAVDDVTPSLIDDFVSRPRPAPRSYNHLHGSLVRFFDWMIHQERLQRSPVRSKPRRGTRVRLPFLLDPAAARRLFDVAGRLPDNRSTTCRGSSFRTIFTLLYGLGLRVGEVSRLRVGDIDATRRVLHIRNTKFAKSRLVPFGRRIGALLTAHIAQRPHRQSLSAEVPVFARRKRTTDQRHDHQPHVPSARAATGSGHPRRRLRPAGPRPAACVRDPHAAALVPEWNRPSLAAFVSRHVSRTRGPGVHGRLSHDDAGAPEPCERAVSHVGRARSRGGAAMTLGALLHAFLVDELPLQKGFRPTSTRAYRDGLRLFLTFVAADRSCRLTQLTPEDMTAERVQRFLLHLEQERHNHRHTRNHRLAILRTFFEFLARRCPERLAAAQRVAAIAVKRTPPAETRFLEREEIAQLFRRLPSVGPFAVRDRALLLLLYNTGARVQEIADLRIADLDLQGQPSVRLHGKGDKWRSLPPLAADRSATERRAPEQTAAAVSQDARLRLPRRTCPDPLRHLQDRPPTHTSPGRSPPCDRPAHQSPRLSTHGRRPSAGSRSRRQRDPRLARSRPPEHDQPVRRDHDPDQARGPPTLRARRNPYGFTPPKCCLARRPGPAVLARFVVNRYVVVHSRSAHEIRLHAGAGPQITNGHTTSITPRWPSRTCWWAGPGADRGVRGVPGRVSVSGGVLRAGQGLGEGFRGDGRETRQEPRVPAAAGGGELGGPQRGDHHGAGGRPADAPAPGRAPGRRSVGRGAPAPAGDACSPSRQLPRRRAGGRQVRTRPRGPRDVLGADSATPTGRCGRSCITTGWRSRSAPR